MRSSAQISRTPSEYHDWQAAERAKIRRELLGALRLADERDDPWYEWVLARSERRHVHHLRDDDGRSVACPYPGCAAVASSKSSALQLDASPATTGQTAALQMELVA